MRIVFLGSGAFAVPSLEALIGAGHEVAALVTQPDREKGRGQKLASPPTKAVAERAGIPVLQPPKVRAPEAVAAVAALRPELQVVVAYGQILPRAVIDLAPLGTVNVHASLLPHLRGAAPIQWAIARGDVETGVTTMLIDEGLDTGPLLASRATPIGGAETAPELETRLARLGAALLIETVTGLAGGSIRPVAQEHARATLAPILKKEDGRLDFALPARLLDGRVRGFHPWPGAFTTVEGRLLKVLRARPLAGDGAEPAIAPATVLGVTTDGALRVRAGEGTELQLLDVQPESRRPMSGAAFAAGARLSAGSRLE